ncbi:MAG: type VI secretion system baseplate subunit TssG [Acidobacteriaceae bacterium]|nr:type VI secretion system baseplate subunit TssG [Acidobacteriaceae bacterium]
MASPVREQDRSVELAEVKEELFAAPHSFDFFQAVRLLELMQADRAVVGNFANPRSEAVRFTVHPSLAFPASAIQSLQPRQDGGAPLMSVNFMGTVGPLGLLPNYYTELVAERLRAHDATLRDFLDIFHHRAISLFYRAWETTHFTVGYEREGRGSMTDRLLELVGLGLPALQSRQVVRDEAILFYGGLLSMTPRSACALQLMLSDYFDVPVEIEQFVGAWRRLEEPDQCCFEIGSDASRQLGLGAVAGDEIWDRQSRARVRVGPLAAARYREFLPGGTAYEPLRSLLRFYSGNDIEFEVQLVLQREEVPACELGDDGDSPQLGWATWIKSSPQFNRDPDDTVLLFAET